MPYLGERTITRRSWATGSWSGGTFTAGASTDSAIRGTWRPMTTTQLQRLAEGDRERDPRVLYTATDLQTVRQGTGQQADHVSPDGGTTWYEVADEYDGYDTAMLAPGVQHRKYACLRVQEGDA
jgi:hypothetical protein